MTIEPHPIGVGVGIGIGVEKHANEPENRNCGQQGHTIIVLESRQDKPVNGGLKRCKRTRNHSTRPCGREESQTRPAKQVRAAGSKPCPCRAIEAGSVGSEQIAMEDEPRKKTGPHGPRCFEKRGRNVSGEDGECDTQRRGLRPWRRAKRSYRNL